MTLEQVTTESKKDATIKSVINAVSTNNWNDELSKPFKSIKLELSVNNEILLKGNQIILPKSLHQSAINLAHQGHLGIEKCKALLREKVYRPTMNRDVRDTIGVFFTCQPIIGTRNRPEPQDKKQFNEHLKTKESDIAVGDFVLLKKERKTNYHQILDPKDLR